MSIRERDVDYRIEQLSDELDDDQDEEDDVDDDDEDLDEDIDEEDEEFLTPEGSVEILARAAAEAKNWYRGGRIVMPTEMRCRVCGCTDQSACLGGCFWAAPNLCSRCVA